MSYVDIAGHPTWVVDEGAGDPVLVLHGCFHGSEAVLPAVECLRGSRRIVAFDRRGHGHTCDLPTPFDYEEMADETIAVLEALGLGRTDIVGYSSGAIAALYVALRRPELVGSMVLIATNIFPSSSPVEDVPDDASTAMMRAAYAAVSPDGAEHFDAVVRKSYDLHARAPNFAPGALQSITARSLVIGGDRDNTVPVEETAALFRSLPNAQLAVVPGASHYVIWERLDEMARLISRFLKPAARSKAWARSSS